MAASLRGNGNAGLFAVVLRRAARRSVRAAEIGCGPSVVQAVAQTLSLLQSSHGQPQVLLQTLDLSLAALLHATQLRALLLVALACLPLLLHGR